MMTPAPQGTDFVFDHSGFVTSGELSIVVSWLALTVVGLLLIVVTRHHFSGGLIPYYVTIWSLVGALLVTLAAATSISNMVLAGHDLDIDSEFVDLAAIIFRAIATIVWIALIMDVSKRPRWLLRLFNLR